MMINAPEIKRKFEVHKIVSLTKEQVEEAIKQYVGEENLVGVETIATELPFLSIKLINKE